MSEAEDEEELQAAIAFSLSGSAVEGGQRKRPRDREDSPSATTLRTDRAAAYFPEIGYDASEFLQDRGLILRHGTSLSLMSLVSEWLNRSEEFSSVDPSADWQKWANRRPGFSLYYAALLDPARDGPDSVRACLRAVLDGVPVPVSPHIPRLIIDYVCTAPGARGAGLASLLVGFATRAAQLSSPPANVYVLATEDSCVYWMTSGYVLEASETLGARLNVFNDTHLLRHRSNAPDYGDAADLELVGDGQQSEEKEDKPPCERDWAELTADQQGHAATLGFDRNTWNGDQWHNVRMSWSDLARHPGAAAAAQALGFKKELWRG
jgi:hypothetical protein